jgi:hypothetical protein
MPGDEWSALRGEVRLLARLDRRHAGRRRRVFGADQHGYRSSPVSLADVQDLEEYAGTALPDDFRQFLLNVGSGAGPYYGISFILVDSRRLLVHHQP